MMTDQKQDDWPTFSEELSRKGLEALNKWLERQEKGGATTRDVFIVADVLSDVMSGLANWDATDVVHGVHNEIRLAAAEAAKKKAAQNGV